MLRDYQIEPVNKAFEILKELKMVYINAEMRTGKTTMALTLAYLLNASSVLFVTPKKVVTDRVVERDYEREGFTFDLDVINYESLHKITKKYDLVVVDEAHKLGAYPKPSLQTRRIKKIVGSAYLILLSGTAHPESMSQLYHQFDISANSPFEEKNFYKWAKNGYVDVKQQVIKGMKFNNYDNANTDKILSVVGKYFVKVSQKDAGFAVSEVQDEVIEIPVDPKIYQLVDILLKHKMYKFRNGDVVLCESAVSLQGKIHQLFSGTIKAENQSYILDMTKAHYIKSNYQNQQVVIFYKYIAEGEALKRTFGDTWTNSPTEFNQREKQVFISQIRSGSTGINLSSADV